MRKVNEESESTQNSITKRLAQFFYLLAGTICALGFVIFVILSIPVYSFRVIVILLAKWLRPDLGEILNSQSSLFAGELFRNVTPRNNIVVCMTVINNASVDDFKMALTNSWIHKIDETNGKLLYPKFQQYPVQFLGFTFYKHAFDTFSLDNHIHFHNEIGTDKPATEEDIIDLTEKLLNSPFPPKRSPWEFHIVHNYVNPKISTEPELSICLFKVHHSLADGYSLSAAFVDAFCINPEALKIPKPRLPATTPLERIKFGLTSPFCVLYEMSDIMSHMFRPCPWRIPDERKAWHQHCWKSDLIPVQKVLDIKNTFGVTFTSVIVSSVSAAIYKALKKKKEGDSASHQDECSSMFFLSALPLPGHSKNLTNHATANLFDVPTYNFGNSLERLHKCHSILEATRSSVIPYGAQYFATLVGCQFTMVGSVIAKNRTVSVGLTNFPAAPVVKCAYNGKICIHIDFTVGALEGNAGVGIMVLSSNQNLRLSASVEKAIMTREEVKEFVQSIQDEINILHTKTRCLAFGNRVFVDDK